MTTEQFVQQLKSRREVDFPSGNRLSAPDLVQYGIAEVLGSLLPEGEVRDALVVASLEDDNRLEWLLLLDHDLLQITGRFVEDQRKYKLTATHKTYPLETLVDVSLEAEQEGEGRQGQAFLRSVRLTLTFTSGAVTVAAALPRDRTKQPQPQGILTFAQRVLAAERA
jgi:hypothetical protein